jgi:hypothetical protein
LTFNYSFDSGSTWTALAVNVASGAASTSAVTCQEIATALSANTTWAELYEASVISDPKAGNWLKVRAKRARGLWKTYISNTSAESKLRFNKKAGVAELPSYFSRHTIANIGEYDGSAGMLIELSNPVSGVDVAIVDDAGLDSSTVQSDYELLAGRSGLFNFQKITVDGSDRITQIIEYPAGSVAGDFARKIQYSYTGANKNPDKITEIPYTLTNSDLVTP